MSELEKALNILEKYHTVESIKNYITNQLDNGELSSLGKIKNRCSFFVTHSIGKAVAASIECDKIMSNYRTEYKEKLENLEFPDEKEFYRKNPFYYIHVNKEGYMVYVMLHRKIDEKYLPLKKGMAFDKYSDYREKLDPSLRRETLNFDHLIQNFEFFDEKNLNFFYSNFDILKKENTINRFGIYEKSSNSHTKVDCFDFKKNNYKIISKSYIITKEKVSKRTFETLGSHSIWYKTKLIIFFNDLEVFNFELINTNKNVSKANKKTLKDGVLSKNSIKTLKLDDWIEDFSLIYKEFKKAKENQIDNDINLDLGKYS